MRKRWIEVGRATKLAIVSTAVCGIAVVVAVSLILSTTPAKSSTTSAPHGPVTSASQAIQLASQTGEVSGITSSAAKLMPFGQLNTATPGVSVPGAGEPAGSEVWAVVLIGRVHDVGPDGPLTPLDEDGWTIVAIDQTSGHGVAVFGGTGSLPSYYQTLPDTSRGGSL